MAQNGPRKLRSPSDAPVSSGYGRRLDPFTGRPAMHTGTDYNAAAGSYVAAAGAGRVVFAGEHPDYGFVVDVDNGNGVVTRYAHLQGADVRVGQEVAEGQPLGRVGSTGRSTGPHLHYEVLGNGRQVDPLGFSPGQYGRIAADEQNAPSSLDFARAPNLHLTSRDAGPVRQSPTSAGPGRGGPSNRISGVDVKAYITQAAIARGIDPAIALRVAASEGGTDGIWRIGDRDIGNSYGPYQLYTGPKGGGGLGTAFQRQTGLELTPETVRQQIDFALDQAAVGGWGPWYGWKGDKRAGLGGARAIGVGAFPSAATGPTPDLVRMAQEYLNDNGIPVPVTGQLDDTTAAAVKAWRSTVPGTAFAERYGLQRPSETPQMGFNPLPEQAPAVQAVNEMAQGTPPRFRTALVNSAGETMNPDGIVTPAPGVDLARPEQVDAAMTGTAPRASVRQVAASRFTDPSGIEYVQPPVQIAQAEQSPAFDVPPSGPGGMMNTPREAWAPPRAQQPAAPVQQQAPGYGTRDNPIPLDEVQSNPNVPWGGMPPTTAPMPNLGTMPPLPPGLGRSAIGPPVPNPLAVDYMSGQPVRSINDLLAGLPPSATTVLPEPVNVLDTIDITGSGGASPMPRPNPLPMAQRGRSGRTPNGYQWQQIPQRGGPSLLQVVSPKGKRWTEIIGPPGGAGLFNEFASSFTPVRRG